MSKKTVEKKELSPNEKKAIIISAICVVMIVVLIVSIVLVVRKPETTPEENKPNTGSSSLYIRNGDFAYFDNDDTAFPKTANNWKKYTYAAPAGESHGFEQLTKTDKVISGVIDTDDKKWETVLSDLTANGISGVSNPGIHNDDLDTTIYMFATKMATTACIQSESFSVSSQSSAKITVWLNTSQIKSGHAVIVLQKYYSTPSAKETDRYVYDMTIEKKDGWQSFEFYLFNRKSGSESITLSVGLGNCYEEEVADGVLFVDDISFETVSANEYRKFVADAEKTSTTHKIIGEDKDIPATDYSDLVSFYTGAAADSLSLEDYLELNNAKVNGEAYSPFTSNDNFKIFKTENDGTNANPVGLMLDTWKNEPIVVQSSEELKDHLHISFWMRLVQNNVTAQANIILQKYEGGEWTDLNNGSFKAIVTPQEIDTDNNCGWTKYDIYLKPTSAQSTTIRLLLVLGNTKGYASQTEYIPDGTLFATQPLVETITSSSYSSASTGSYSKKVSLVGNTASTSITNGSFSSLTTSTPVQPDKWAPVYAGYNAIYKDGKGNDKEILSKIDTSVTAVESKVIRNNGESANGVYAPYYDDSEQNFLMIDNKYATSFGYLSTDISLSARTVYAFSVLAKTSAESVKPYIYIVKDNAESRSAAIIGKVDDTTTGTGAADDTKLGFASCAEDLANGWTRYYIIVITGEETETIRVALFNGSITGKTQQGVVYYDYVAMNALGTYTVDTTEYDDEKDEPAKRDRISFTAADGYTAFEKLTAEEISKLAEAANVEVTTQPDWDKIVDNALAKPAEETPDEKPASNGVDWALLLSVISSVALVTALLIVVVIKLFKKRNRV